MSIKELTTVIEAIEPVHFGDLEDCSWRQIRLCLHLTHGILISDQA